MPKLCCSAGSQAAVTPRVHWAAGRTGVRTCTEWQCSEACPGWDKVCVLYGACFQAALTYHVHVCPECVGFAAIVGRCVLLALRILSPQDGGIPPFVSLAAGFASRVMQRRPPARLHEPSSFFLDWSGRGRALVAVGRCVGLQPKQQQQRDACLLVEPKLRCLCSSPP